MPHQRSSSFLISTRTPFILLPHNLFDTCCSSDPHIMHENRLTFIQGLSILQDERKQTLRSV